MYVYCFYAAMLKNPNHLPKCLTRAQTSVILIVFNHILSIYTVTNKDLFGP